MNLKHTQKQTEQNIKRPHGTSPTNPPFSICALREEFNYIRGTAQVETKFELWMSLKTKASKRRTLSRQCVYTDFLNIYVHLFIHSNITYYTTRAKQLT